jgi:hypothetical protein
MRRAVDSAAKLSEHAELAHSEAWRSARGVDDLGLAIARRQGAETRPVGAESREALLNYTKRLRAENLSSILVTHTVYQPIECATDSWS